MGLILGSVKKVLDKDHADPLNVQLLIVVNVKIFKFLNKNIKMLLVVMQDVQKIFIGSHETSECSTKKIGFGWGSCSLSEYSTFKQICGWRLFTFLNIQFKRKRRCSYYTASTMIRYIFTLIYITVTKGSYQCYKNMN